MHPAPLPLEPEILFSQKKHTGLITLNRPKALNAINLEMITDIYDQLLQWKDDSSIHAVIIKGVGEKAFCAGGDVRAVYYAKKAGDRDYCDLIFRREYMLNHLIGTYPKPYIAFMDGITMGGGLGLSAHGKHRVVTERSVLAMPESTIGFFTDIGASFFLNRCPGQIGVYLGLTGNRISAGDALFTNLANAYCPSDQLGDLEESIVNSDGEDIQKLLKSPFPASPLQSQQPIIDAVFKDDRLEGILGALKTHANPLCQEWAEGLLTKCPTSLKITLALLSRHQGLDLAQCLIEEFRVSQHCVDADNFFEGVRALLVDKDQSPKWSPSTLESVTQEIVAGYFAPLTDREELVL